MESLHSEIKFKEYYNPFESALVVSPNELIQKYERKFCHILPFYLSNYSDLSISIGKSKKLLIFPREIVLAKLVGKMEFDYTSRYLNLGNCKLLVTGGIANEETSNSMAFVLDLVTGEKENLPLLKIPRKRHCMTWIQGSPAVIGGFNGRVSLPDVEVYLDFEWKIFPHLNRPRNSLSAVSVSQEVYVAGGANQKNPLNSIEVFSWPYSEWKELDVKLPICVYNVGLFHINNKLLVFGGVMIENKNQEETSRAFIIEINSKEVKEVQSLKKPMSFPYNMFRANENPIFITSIGNTIEEVVISLDKFLD